MKISIGFVTLLLAFALGEQLDDILLKRLEKVKDDFINIEDYLGAEGNEKRAIPYTRGVGTCKLEENTDECTKTFAKNGAKVQWKLETELNNRNQIYDNSETNGKFWAAYVPNNLKRNEFGELSNTFKLEAKEQCVSFRYYMYDRYNCDIARFTVKAKCGNRDEVTLLQESSSANQYRWTYVTVPVEGAVGEDCKLTFRAAKGLNYGKLAIDDIDVHREKCPAEGILFPAAMNCNLQKNLCEWTEEGDTDVINYNHRTPSQDTGPAKTLDRGFGRTTGNFMYLESSDSDTKKVTITSPKVKSRENSCMRILANMHGKDIGGMQILLNGKEKNSEKGNKGSEWFEKWIDLPANTVNQVSIVLETGTGDKGDIAIDDIMVQNGQCKDLQQLVACHFQPDSESCEVGKVSNCETTVVDEKVGDDQTKVLNMKSSRTNCYRRHFPVSLKIPENVRTPRSGCFTFDYKVNKAPADKRYCHMFINQGRHRIGERKDSYFGNTWRKAKFPLRNGGFEAGKGKDNKFTISIFNHSPTSCPDLSIANLRLLDGPCQ